MSEFFLELFSEEIPSNLQKNLREDLLKKFNLLFSEKFKIVPLLSKKIKVFLSVINNSGW